MSEQSKAGLFGGKQDRWMTIGGIRINRRHLTRWQNFRLGLLWTALRLPALLRSQAGTGQFSRVGGGFALDIVTGRAAGPGARTMYLAIIASGSAPTDATTNTTMVEISETGYARQACAWTAPTAATPPSTNNSAVLTYGPLTGTMTVATYAALVSSASGTTGDFVCYWTLTTPRTPVANDSLQAAIASFVMTDE
jgi:hypothetical protein